MASKKYGTKQRDTARSLRESATDAERKLWRLLRRKRMKVRFRRQQPVGPFVADFFCPSAKLIIELDGSQHAEEEHRVKDARRTRWLESRGYRVLRFWNLDVLKTPEMVMETIAGALVGSPLPENCAPDRAQFSTLPQGEG
jgi:very-short-patch-repair endonuclease